MHTSKVLIVDDSPYVHKLVRAHLGPDWVNVHSAYDGEAGLNEVEDLRPSLVLMDVDMPGLDGLEACRQLKRNPRISETPVIFLTADCSTQDKVKAFEMGALDYITKPFKPEELRARVLAALRARVHLDGAVMIDPTTGLWTQAYLNVQMPAQLSLARRTSHPLSCIYVDIDSLDAIQSEHGRQTSERLIKNTAGSLLALSRAEDTLCHLGRGRFVILQPATNRAAAAYSAGRMRSDIEQQFLCVDDRSVSVTCSFGVADSHLDAEGLLLDCSEQALTRAKKAGGNTVTVAGPFSSDPV